MRTALDSTRPTRERVAPVKLGSPALPQLVPLKRTARRPRLGLGSPALTAGLLIVGVVVLVAALAPQVAPHDATAIDARARLLAPDATHPFGTDLYGRDLFSRVLYGAGLSVPVAVVTTLIGAIPGLLLGMLSGMRRGWFDALLTQCMDAWLALPGLLLALVLAASFGRSLTVLSIALGLAVIPMFYRVVRAEALRVSGEPFVEAAESLGASRIQVIWRHVLPNVAPVYVVLLTVTAGRMLLAVSALSFIGLGAPPPAPEWGALLAEGRDYMHMAWWLTWFPGLAIAVTTFGFFLLGDGLRDLLDPEYRRR